MKFFPVKIFYRVEGQTLVVYLCGRGEDQKRYEFKLVGTKPHFYAPEYVEHPMVTGKTPNAIVNLQQEPLWRIDVRFPFQVPEVRRSYPITYESDVTYDMRIRYDHGIKDCIEVDMTGESPIIKPEQIRPTTGSIEPRVWSLDIETFDKKGFSKPDHPTAPVVSIAISDRSRGKYLVLFNGILKQDERDKLTAICVKEDLKLQLMEYDSEKELFAGLKDAFERIGPDIVVGWNVTDFDLTYLRERARTQRFSHPDWDRYAWFDDMEGYVRLHDGQLESKALDYTAQSEGVGAKSNQGKRIWELYENDRPGLIYYNINDTRLVDGIDKKRGVLDFHLRLARYAGCGLEDTMSNGRMVDSYTFHRLGGVAAQISRAFSDSQPVEGARVFDATMGVHRNVAEIDLKQEYPTVMRTYNMSPETKRPTGTPDCFILPSGNQYLKEPRGLFPTILDELSAQRDLIRDADQNRVAKFFMNSFYGVLSSEHYRNRDREIAGDITDVARRHLDWNRAFLQSHETRILYGDTDSCHFTLNGVYEYLLVKDQVTKLVAVLQETYDGFAAQWGAVKHFFKVKVERVSFALLMTDAKKRYALLYEDPAGDIDYQGFKCKMKIVGFEVRRSNSAPFTRYCQKELIKLILTGSSIEEIRGLLQRLITQSRDGKLDPKELRLPGGVHNMKANTMHARAARWSNQYLGKDFKEGDKPCLYFGSIPGLPSTDVFALEWNDALPKGAVIDWDRTFQRVLYQPLEPLLGVLGIRWDEIVSGYRTSTLGDFL